MTSGIYNDFAELYDIAFSWDVSDEVKWLSERIGKPNPTVLEVACGSGRMFASLLGQGFEVTGLDIEPVMLDRARERMAKLKIPCPALHCADMTDFDLDQKFDALICPINSLGHVLTLEKMKSHIHCVGSHLSSGGKYLFQLAMYDTLDGDIGSSQSDSWEMERDGTRVRTTWRVIERDLESRTETQEWRFEILNGPDTGKVISGKVISGKETMRFWTWEEWHTLIEESPFTYAHAYDGNKPERPEIRTDGSDGDFLLAWHEFVVE